MAWHEVKLFQQTRAGFLDISTDGCRLIAEDVPPRPNSALIRLHGPLLPVWYEAKILSVQIFGAKGHLVRLGFPESCPYELFMAVAYGMASRDAGHRQPQRTTPSEAEVSGRW